MTRRDIGEANIVRQGLASIALEDGATDGQVPAVQADGQVLFEDQSGGGGGGSQTVKYVDLGVVTAAALAVSGARTLYTTAAGEFVSAVRFGDAFTAVDTSGLEIELALGAWNGNAADSNNRIPYGILVTAPGGPGDAAASGIRGGSLFNAGADNVGHVSPPLLAGALVATLGMPSDPSSLGTTPGWQANHTYPDYGAVIAAGHYWDLGGSPGGASGGSTPDFAGNIGGSVVDGAIEWWDEGATPAAGSFHVYIEVVTPATP